MYCWAYSCTVGVTHVLLGLLMYCWAYSCTVWLGASAAAGTSKVRYLILTEMCLKRRVLERKGAARMSKLCCLSRQLNCKH